MGLVRNLKKRLTDWGEKILVELSCLYIKQLAKQTTKRRDNSSPTMSSQNHLTTEPRGTIIATSSAGTSEKIIMMQTEDIVAHAREWAIDRVGDIHEEVSKFQHDDGELDNAYALYQEFAEWIEPESEDLEIVSLDEITEEEYNDYIERS